MSIGSVTSAALTSCLGLLASVLACSIAHAAVLLPGQGKTPIEEIPFNFQIAAAQTQDFFIGGVKAGSIVDRVLKLESGFLAFETRVIVEAGFSINQVQRTNYAGFTTDARPEPDSIGDFPPDFAERPSLTGTMVQFDFDAQAVPGGGTGSNFFAILTNATSFANVGTLRAGSNGSFSDFVTAFSPIPEPREWVCLLAGLGLLATIARRRR